MNLKPIVAVLMAGSLTLAHAAHKPMHAHAKKTCHNAAKQISAFAGNSYVSTSCKRHGIQLNGQLDLVASRTKTSAAEHDFFGLDHANLFMGAKLSKAAHAQLNMQYGQANLFNTDATQDHNNDFAVNEAFLTYQLVDGKLQLKAGQFFSSFGAYDAYTADPNLTQALTQTNDDMVEATFVPMHGAFVKGWVFKHPITGEKQSFNKFGAKVGYQVRTHGAVVDADFAVLNDARVLSASNQKGEMGQKETYMVDMQDAATYNKAAAYNGHVGVAFGAAHVDANILRFAKAVAGANTQPQIMGVGVSYAMQVMGKDSKLAVSYEKANDKGHAVFFAKSRVAADYTVALAKKLDLVAGYSQLKVEPTSASTTGDVKIARVGIKANF